FPTVYGAKVKVLESRMQVQESTLEIQKKQLFEALSLAYGRYQVLHEKARLYHDLDSVYAQFAHSAQRRFAWGETNYLEQATAQAKQRQVVNTYAKIKQQLLAAQVEIGSLVQAGDSLSIAIERPEKLAVANTVPLSGT